MTSRIKRVKPVGSFDWPVVYPQDIFPLDFLQSSTVKKKAEEWAVDTNGKLEFSHMLIIMHISRLSHQHIRKNSIEVDERTIKR